MLLTFASIFLGVFLPFLINRFHEYYVNNKRRRRVLELVKEELGQCSETRFGDIMPTNSWEAAVSSGYIMLLDTDLLRQKDIDTMGLGKLYYRINMFHYELQYLRQFRGKVLITGGRDVRDAHAHKELVHAHKDLMVQIKKKILAISDFLDP